MLALSEDGCISICHPIGDDCLLTPTPWDSEEPVAPAMRHGSTGGTDNDTVDDGGEDVGGGGTNAHVSKRMTEPRPTLG